MTGHGHCDTAALDRIKSALTPEMEVEDFLQLLMKEGLPAAIAKGFTCISENAAYSFEPGEWVMWHLSRPPAQRCHAYNAFPEARRLFLTFARYPNGTFVQSYNGLALMLHTVVPAGEPPDLEDLEANWKSTFLKSNMLFDNPGKQELEMVVAYGSFRSADVLAITGTRLGELEGRFISSGYCTDLTKFTDKVVACTADGDARRRYIASYTIAEIQALATHLNIKSFDLGLRQFWSRQPSQRTFAASVLQDSLPKFLESAVIIG